MDELMASLLRPLGRCACQGRACSSSLTPTMGLVLQACLTAAKLPQNNFDSVLTVDSENLQTFMTRSVFRFH